jgi:uncharacterized protein (DUF58 family)
MSLSPAQNKTVDESGDGLVYASQAQLIALRGAGERLSLKAGRIAAQQSGGYISRFKGRGMEFDEARRYQPGDDVRTLDWRVTARTGVPHTKLFREERERAVLTWVDMRPSMFFATRGVFKSVQAAKAASLLAWSANQHGDRLGSLVFTADDHHEIRPKRGKATTLHLLQQLSAASQWSGDTANNTDASESLGRLRRVAKPGSLIFLISDFRNMGEQAESHLAQLARHNDVVLFYIYDHLETELPPNGSYSVSWQQRLSTFNSTQKSREHYRNSYQAHLDYLEKLARFPSVYSIHCATDDDVLQKLQFGLGMRSR